MRQPKLNYYSQIKREEMNMILTAFIVALLFIIVSVVKFKLHPFIALLLGAIIMGGLGGMDLSETMTTIAGGFGGTMGDIGILILLGVALGELLHNSGATRNIADQLLRWLGVKNTPLAMNIAGYLICIPVFMDAAFVILIDLLKQLSKEGKIVLNTLVCALIVGLLTTHAIVIPTPGPLAVASALGANIAWFIFYSLIISLPASIIGGVVYGKWLGKKYPAWGNVTVDETLPDVPVAMTSTATERETASGNMGIFLILLPIVLIIAGSVAKMMIPETSAAYSVVNFLSNTNVIMLFVVFIAFFALRKYLVDSFDTIVSNAAESVGSIIAIICAGGAFGSVISASGLGDFIVAGLQSFGVPVILLAYLLAIILHCGLGSITVALVTTSAVVAPLIAAAGVSPVLVGLAICAGGMGLPLPNDSSFWTVNKFSGLAVGDTFRSLTIPVTISSIVAFAVVLLLNACQGFLPGLF